MAEAFKTPTFAPPANFGHVEGEVVSLIQSRTTVGAVLFAFVLSLMIAAPSAADERSDDHDQADRCHADHESPVAEHHERDGCTDSTLTIVSSLPLSLGPGDQSVISHSIVNAIQMALADAGNRVGRTQISYRSLDDGTSAGGTWPVEVANANQAATDPSVVAYIGPFNSSAARKSIPILCTAGLGMVSPTNTYDGLTKALPVNAPGEPGIYYPNGCARNYSRVLPRDSIGGELAAVRAQGLGATRGYVVQTMTNDLWAYGFVTRATQLGLPLAADETIVGQAPSFAALGQRVAASSADFLFLSCFQGQENCGLIVRDVRAAAPNIRIMISDVASYPGFLTQAGAAGEGVLVVREFVSPRDYTGAAAAWHARYETLYGPETGDGFNATLYAYDATRAVLAAIGRAGPHPDRNSVRAALMSTVNFPGLLGRWSFDADGDTTLSILSTAEVQGGVWVNTGTATLP